MKGIVLLTVLLAVFSSTHGHPPEDLVENLPGLNFNTSYRQYSGYLNATADRYLHYWFIESSNDPDNDPLILWLNGGPGCSSLLGLLTELGPFYVDQAGSGELHPNPYSWNTFANILYLESPACVGFSYDSTGSCGSNDNSTALQNYLALQDFFTEFEEFTTKPFYITGESYAGIYIPTLTKLIIDGNDTFPLNLQGFAIGNGYFDIPDNDNSLMFYIYHHAVIGDVLWDNLINSCCVDGIASRDNCEFSTTKNLFTPECITYVDEALFRVDANGLIPYNLYSQCGEYEASGDSPTVNVNTRQHVELNTIFPRNKIHRSPKPLEIIDINTYDPSCSDNSIEENWLNDPATRAALHIADVANDWKPCSNLVNLEYRRQYDSTVDIIAYNAARVRALIYNGDVDMVCNYLGNLWSIEGLGLNVVEDRHKWMCNGQVGGFVKRFDNLDFLTVRGAGHEVPGYKPIESLQMIKAFIEQTPY